MNKNDLLNDIKIKKLAEYVQEMLYQVKNGEVDLNTVSLLDIVEKYLSYMIFSIPKQIDLDLAADFLVSISTLILWKSDLLLPVYREECTDNEEDNGLREEYWREYRKYQSLIQVFTEKEVNQRDIYFTTLNPNLENKEKYQKNHFSELILAIESILSKKKDQDIIQFTKREYNVSQKILEIEEKFGQNHGQLSFQNIISGAYSKIEIIISFLALLELICLGKVDYRQSKNFGEIIFYRKEDQRLKKKTIHP